MNMAGLTLIAWHWRHQLTLGHYLFALLFGAVAVNMGYLLFYPLNTEYFGFSALLYTLLTYSCIITIRHEKWINLFILSAVSFAVLRPLWADGAGQSSQELIGVRVATESHLYGWIGGFIAGGTWWARQLQANVKPTPT
jgi:membrane associated rhomboid family serine protease